MSMLRAFIFAYGFFLDVFRLLGALAFIAAAGVIAVFLGLMARDRMPEPSLGEIAFVVACLVVLLIGIRGGIREVTRRDLD